MADILGGNPHLFAIEIAFKPYAYRSDRRLFSPYYKKVADTLVYQPIETVYDYTVRDWYTEPLEQGSNIWIEPFFGIMGGTPVTAYSAMQLFSVLPCCPYLFATAKHLSLLQYRNNLVSKLVYWPGIPGALFAITLIVFY